MNKKGYLIFASKELRMEEFDFTDANNTIGTHYNIGQSNETYFSESDHPLRLIGYFREYRLIPQEYVGEGYKSVKLKLRLLYYIEEDLELLHRWIGPDRNLSELVAESMLLETSKKEEES